MCYIFSTRLQEFSYLTRDDPTAYSPPPSFGPFRVLHQVGVGVLGPVFRTYEPTRDRLVAVKVFRLDITPEQAQALAEELSSSTEAGLFHPSIVEPIAAGVEGTVAYRAEEYVAAESLDVALRHYAPAPIEKVLPFITQLAGAIDFARASGVGHGALHPRDIFVTPDEARATGFGVVEALERVGLRAPVRRPYSAPERVAGERWVTAADVFSLGVIAYELLTSRRPAGIGADIGPLTGASVGDHADAVHAVLARAMEEDPSRRFQTGLAFASALEAAARGNVESPGMVGTAAAAAATATAAVDEMPLRTEPATDEEIDDALDEMPPPQGIDEHEEPAEAEREEDAFRADQPEFDDEPIVAAADDEARFAFSREKTGPRGGVVRDDGDLFDEEAEEELTLEPARPRFSDDFSLEEPDKEDASALPDREDAGDRDAQATVIPVAAASRLHEEPPDYVQEPAPRLFEASRRYSSITEPPLVAERARPAVLPIAVMLILGMLLAYGAGYVVGSRKVPAQTEQAGGSGESPRTPAAQPGDKGKEYSEQAVAQPQQQPPSEPPAIPAETPPSGGPPAAPATPKSGSITVNSTPSRAGVTVDGVWRGRTPLTIDNLKLGSYEIRVVQRGFGVERHVVPLTLDAPVRTISVKLQPTSEAAAAPTERPQPGAKTGSLYVDSRPRGAQVILDGKPVGTTPMQIGDVSPGPHAVRIELADHLPWRTSTTIIAGRPARVSGSLERIR